MKIGRRISYFLLPVFQVDLSSFFGFVTPNIRPPSLYICSDNIFGVANYPIDSFPTAPIKRAHSSGVFAKRLQLPTLTFFNPTFLTAK